MTKTEGFLFDVHEGRDTVVLWVYRDDGRLLRLEAGFHPAVCARAARSHLQAAAHALARAGLAVRFRLTEGTEFWSGKTIEVGEFLVLRYEDKRRIVARLGAQFGESALFNADLPVPQHYLYAHDLFPLGRLAVEHEGTCAHRAYALDSPWKTDYPMPTLRILELYTTRPSFFPINRGNPLVLRGEGVHYELDPRRRRDLLQIINRVLRRVDPDIILSQDGDAMIFPWLIQAAERERLPLAFDRDAIPTRRAAVREGHSYMSYGRIIYKPPSYPCFGRWHIDRAGSFITTDTGLDGLVELSRLARMSPQRMARTTPGTAMTSIECYEAFRRRVLIPYQKAEPEKYKTAWDLLLSDKGGLVYTQPIGAFENVAEIDYASMYPTLMMKKNLSPETVRCSCCANVRVPEIGYNVCERREGLLPLSLRPVLEQRRAYKALKQQSGGERRTVYDRRQRALKWLLVTAFGFTGYRNARFGRIECHEATTAWGRELLLQAKEQAELHGFQLLHALTDSLWITKPSMYEEEVRFLCREITRRTEVEMTVEAIYRWLVFLPSRENARRGVACRYFGRMQHTELKVRGLLGRRHDTPAFIREAQEVLLRLLGSAETLAACREKRRAAREQLEEWLEDLAAGRVPPDRLLITRRLSKAPEAYRTRTLTSDAVRQLLSARVRLHPGQMIRFLVVNPKRPPAARCPSDAGSARALAEAFIESAQGYDIAYYKKLLYAAADEVLSF